ncbi:MAG: DNA repair protein RecO [Candidatus Margulisiibacteriota bacterium]
MIPLQRIEGIVLSAKPFFEHDKLLVLFTKDLGKCRVLAKSVLNKKNAPLGAMDATAHIDCLFFAGRQFYYSRDIRLLSVFGNLRKRLSNLTAAAYVLHVVDQLTDDGQPHPVLFDLLHQALDTLNREEESLPAVFRFHAELLHAEGLLATDDGTLNFIQFRRHFEHYTGKSLKIPPLLNVAGTV